MCSPLPPRPAFIGEFIYTSPIDRTAVDVSCYLSPESRLSVASQLLPGASRRHDNSRQVIMRSYFHLLTRSLYSQRTLREFRPPPRMISSDNFVFRYMLSPVRLSSVCNARAQYSGGCNFPQYFYSIWYLGHPLISTENFTEIVPGEPLRRGS